MNALAERISVRYSSRLQANVWPWHGGTDGHANQEEHLRTFYVLFQHICVKVYGLPAVKVCCSFHELMSRKDNHLYLELFHEILIYKA